MPNKKVMCGCVLTGSLISPLVFAQDNGMSAAELLELLKARGVEVPADLTSNDDGTVSVAAPAEESSSQQAAAPPQAPAPVPAPEPEVTWKNRFELGFGASFGNTENKNLSLGFTSERITERTELKFDAAYYYEEDDGDETENKFTAGVQHDWLIPESRWRYFVLGRFDFDEFQDWDYRVNAAGGVGYTLINKDNVELILRAGLGFSREFESANDDFVFEAVAGADFEWTITENQSITADTRIYPSLSDGGEFRTLSNAAYKIKINAEEGLALSFGLLHEYQSDVGPATDEHDLKLNAALVFEF
ncbi:MAG: DUF481 domain-containing protein [Planctomycetota bacterium]